MKYALITLVLATLAAADCAADNCLRALRANHIPGRLGEAQQFCDSFAAQGVAAGDIDVPSWALDACSDTQHAPLDARLISACNCLAAAPILSVSTATRTLTRSASITSISVTSTSKHVSPTLYQPCAQVSSSSALQKAAVPAAVPTVPAQLAHDCLKSIPLNKAAALQLVDSMAPYLEWQSDTAWKKNPPADYFYPPHDIFGYLASVRANLEADKYSNELEFQEDLYELFGRAHDGHFIFFPDALTKAFQYGRRRSLVSISEDGTSLPVIKLYQDVISSPSTASTVTQINGVDASKYVADLIFKGSPNQDPDAAYNSMFFTKGFRANHLGNGSFSGGGRICYNYPGSKTNFNFANGTTLVTENFAWVTGVFDGVTDGASFYNNFCTGPDAGLNKTADERNPPVTVVRGYPEPILIMSDGVVSGYYLNGTGFEDVAVFSVIHFAPNDPAEFQSVTEQFFATAKRDGKTKIVIDLSANTGGLILLGYELFRLLFPSIVQDGNSRIRESDTLMAISDIFSANSANFNPDTASNNVIHEHQSFFNYGFDWNITNQPFLTFQDKFGPNVIKGINYTELMRWNFDDPLLTTNETYGIGFEITGYGSRKNYTQPFAAEDIIMLYDGFCASTCTTFSELMRTQGGVKSIAMGGRPVPGPIQAVGGIKGTQILSYNNILFYAGVALETASKDQAAILSRLTDYASNRSTGAYINLRDNILPDHVSDGLPGQFVREEADCRLFYTQDMVTDVTATWKAAARVAFHGAKCVAGSLPKRSVDETVEKRRMVTPVVKKTFKQRSTKERSAEWVQRHGRKAVV